MKQSMISPRFRAILKDPKKHARLREMIVSKEYEVVHDGSRSIMVVKWEEENGTKGLVSEKQKLQD